jgi:hypothetical protein
MGVELFTTSNTESKVLNEINHIIAFGVGGKDGGSKEQESAIETPRYSPPPSAFKP